MKEQKGRFVKTIFLDLDDTLWATQANNKEALHELFHLYDWGRVHASFDSFFSKYAPHNDFLWAEYRHGHITKQELILGRFGHPLSSLEGLSEEYILGVNEEFLRRTALKSGLEDGAVELLTYLKQHYRKLVVVSNGFCEVQEQKMKSAGIDSYIDHTILSEEAGAAKPSPIIFQRALSVSGSRASEAVFIGDSWDADILGAQGVGIATIWYNPKGLPLPSPLEEFRFPAYMVRHLSEVPSLLRTMIPV